MGIINLLPECSFRSKLSDHHRGDKGALGGNSNGYIPCEENNIQRIKLQGKKNLCGS